MTRQTTSGPILLSTSNRTMPPSTFSSSPVCTSAHIQHQRAEGLVVKHSAHRPSARLLIPRINSTTFRI